MPDRVKFTNFTNANGSKQAVALDKISFDPETKKLTMYSSIDETIKEETTIPATDVEVDDTLAIEGKAADSKVAGDAIKDVIQIGGTPSKFTGMVISSTSEEVDLVEQSAFDAEIAKFNAKVGSPLVAATASAMTDTTKIYVYTGSETGYTSGNWYYYNGSTWTSGGVYNSAAVETDKTLGISDMPADAKVTGDEIDALKEDLGKKIIPSKNLLNVENNVPNTYINQNTGVETAYTNWQSSEYIPVEAGTDYELIVWKSAASWDTTKDVYYAFYNANKEYTHGSYTDDVRGYVLSAESGDSYLRVSAQNLTMSTNKPIVGKATDLASIIGSTDIDDYIPYGNTLLKDTLKAEFDSYVANNNSAISAINDSLKSVSIILPATVYIAVGRQITFYKPNYLRCKNPDDYVCYWSTSLANVSFNENIRFEPTTTGTYLAQLFIMNRYTRETVAQKDISIVVVADTARTNKKVLFIGDSLTNAGFYPYEIQKHLSAEGVESIGTITTTAYLDSDPEVTTRVSVNHEGRGGWSAQDYITKVSKSGVVNAFWNPNTSAFDFEYYLTNNNYSLPDIVFVNLGTNGTVNPTAEINAIKTIIASIRAYSAIVPIVVSAIPCGNATQNQYADIYLTQIRELQVAEFDGVMSNVYIAPIYLNINRETDWKTETVAESARNPVEVTRQINSVHPSKYGYYKLADVYWSVIQQILG